MKYPISRQFGLYAHFHPPVSRAALPLINLVLRLLPRFPLVRKGYSVKKTQYASADGAPVTAWLIEPHSVVSNAPCLVYYHGGGFVMRAAPSHYALAVEYALKTPCKVLLVDYRLAPRYPHPTPLNDCYGAYSYALSNARELGIDETRIALCGDSAGGALACGVSLMARDRLSPSMRPCFQLLVYPATDRRMETSSMRTYTDTPMWNARLNAKMWRWYMPDVPLEHIEYVSPAEAASFAGLPSAYIETAEFDCLRDEGELYAKALGLTGVPVETRRINAAMHGYDAVLGCDIVRACIEARIKALRRAFKTEHTPE